MRNVLFLLSVFLLSVGFVSGVTSVVSPVSNSVSNVAFVNVSSSVGNVVNFSMSRSGLNFNSDWAGSWSCNNISGVGDSASLCTDSVNRQNFSISSYQYRSGLYGLGLFANLTGSGSFNPKVGDPLLQQTLGNTSYSWIVSFYVTDVPTTLCQSNLGGSGANLPRKGFVEHRDARLSLGLDEGNKPLLRFGTSTNFTTDWVGSDIKLVYSNTKAVPFNTWSTVAMTVNTSSKRLELYYNGVLVGNGTYTASLDNFAKYDNRTYFGSNFASICTQYGRGSVPEGVTMDEWRTFNRALSPSEIAEQSGIVMQKYSSNSYSFFVNESLTVLNGSVYNYSFSVFNASGSETAVLNNVSFVVQNVSNPLLTVYNVTIPASCNPSYNDTLLVYTSTSNFSASVAQYFVNQRGVCKVLGVYNDNAKPYFVMGFQQTNQTIYKPIRDWLVANGSVNYIVLSTDIPVYTKENTYQAPNPTQYYSHSLDSDIADLVWRDDKLWYDSSSRVVNPFYQYNSSVRFNSSVYNFTIVTRIGGTTYANSTRWIDSSRSFTKASRNSNTNAVLINTIGAFTTDLRVLNSTLRAEGINISYYNESNPAKVDCGRYFNNTVYWTMYDPATSTSQGCWVNATPVAGSFFASLYSFAGEINYQTMLVGNTTRETNAIGATDLGFTLVFGSAREPFTSGTIQQRSLAPNFVRDGMFYGDVAWSALPYLAWTQVVYADPKASYPVNSLSFTQNSSTANPYVNATIRISHPPSWNYSNFSIVYMWYVNGSYLSNGTLSGLSEGVDYVTPNLFVGAPATEYNMSIVTFLYKDGVNSGFNISSNKDFISANYELYCNTVNCVDVADGRVVSNNRSASSKVCSSVGCV